MAQYRTSGRFQCRHFADLIAVEVLRQGGGGKDLRGTDSLSDLMHQLRDRRCIDDRIRIRRTTQGGDAAGGCRGGAG